MKYKVWGIGFGRTGTRSLIAALSILGYEKIRHNTPFFEDLRELEVSAEAICARYYQYLDVRFPNSKFILTTREVNSWLASCKKAIEIIYPVSRIPCNQIYYDLMIRNRLTRYGCIDYNEEILRINYYKHHLDVYSYFRNRSNDLLTMNILEGDGWEKLCPFLGLEVPDIAFPQIDENNVQ